MLKNLMFTSLCLSVVKSSVWEREAGEEQVCDEGFKTRIVLTSNSDGELTAYEVEKDDSSQIRLRRKWRQMTICSRENTFSSRRHHDIYNEFAGNAIQHNSQARNSQLDMSFQIYGKYMAKAFLNEHTHQKAFERMVRDIQTSSQVKTRFAVTGHITTDFFSSESDGRVDNLPG